LWYVRLDITAKARRFDKPVVWLKGEVKTPHFSLEARVEAGFLLRRLQRGEILGLPHSWPMPVIGVQCHELRINDENQTWRIVYHITSDAVVILDAFSKKTAATPGAVVSNCKRRLAAYQAVVSSGERSRG
jgi:phage-related protein